MTNVPKIVTLLLHFLTRLYIFCNFFFNIACLGFSEGAGKSVMLWAFDMSHIFPNPQFPIRKQIWSTAVLCRTYLPVW